MYHSILADSCSPVGSSDCSVFKFLSHLWKNKEGGQKKEGKCQVTGYGTASWPRLSPVNPHAVRAEEWKLF